MDNLKQFKWSDPQTGFKITPEHQSQGIDFEGMPGGMLSISSSAGGGDGEVIVWATHPKEDAWLPAPLGSWQSIPKPVDGILYAFDARDITTPLWSSDLRSQDKLGEFSKFASPTIWNGRVYVATFSGELQVYGLCGKPTPCIQ
jgi:hypothetical protein